MTKREKLLRDLKYDNGYDHLTCACLASNITANTHRLRLCFTLWLILIDVGEIWLLGRGGSLVQHSAEHSAPVLGQHAVLAYLHFELNCLH